MKLILFGLPVRRAWVCIWDSEALDLEVRLKEVSKKLSEAERAMAMLRSLGMGLGSRIR